MNFRARLGASPGSYNILPELKKETSEITVHRYGPDLHEISKNVGLEDLQSILSKDGVKWIHINRIHDPLTLDWLRKTLNADPMVLEDISNFDVKPKVEEHEGMLFFIGKLPFINESGDIHVDHVAILLYEDKIVTMTESKGDAFEPLVRRLRSPTGRMRRFGSGYMAYAALDALLDSFILTSKTFEERIESLEDSLDDDIADELVLPINRLKRSVSQIRKESIPMHQLAMELKGIESDLINSEDMRLYLNDLYEHSTYVAESLEGSREVLNDMHQLCLAIISNNMNKVMKVLTVVATIFIPLTFIAGIYGMNFVNIPELEMEMGYYIALAGMTLIGVVMLMVFRRRGWF